MSAAPARILVSLPLPTRLLSANVKTHWRQRAEAVKVYRQLAWVISRQALAEARMEPPRWTAAWCTARFFYATRRHRDTDNALYSLKAAFDGVADAGIVANDRALRHRPVELGLDPARPRVELTFEEARDDAAH